MSPVQIALALLAGAASVAGGAVGTVTWADARYVAQEKFSDLLWSTMKTEIRELRKAIAADPNNQGLKDDLSEVLDRFCKSYPNDRECSG